MSRKKIRDLLQVFVGVASVTAMYMSFALFTVLVITSTGCNPARKAFLESLEGSGGGQDAIVVDMPFAAGYSSKCVQGPGGSYSHLYNSTLYDLDLDTPNNQDDPMFAPVDGTIYIHSDLSSGFGLHGNIDLGDGTYLNLSHMNQTFVQSGEEVAAGQLIGFEGSTGDSSGDHVHMGRHKGEAYKDAGLGVSVEGLDVRVADGFFNKEIATTDMSCDLSWGEFYTSVLPVSAWHPNGSLVMEPGKTTVYLIEDGKKRAFLNEDLFWSLNYQFSDVSVVTEQELTCYEFGASIADSGEIRAAYSDDTLWLLVGSLDDPARMRYELRSTGWEGVLKSWGVYLNDPVLANDQTAVDNVDDYPRVGFAPYRDGSLLVGVRDSTVYVIGDGIAMPIVDWNTFLLLDLNGHSLIEVEDESIPAIMTRVGDCATDVYCVTQSDVTTCGGPSDVDETIIVDTGNGSTTDDDSESTESACDQHVLSWYPDNSSGDGAYLSSATDGQLWVQETSQWWDNPADTVIGDTTELRSNVFACSGDSFTVNGTFMNFADVPHSGDGQWWLCADPWNPRYWGSFMLDGVPLSTGNGLTVFSLDTDVSGDPSAGDEVGCTVTIP